ncbi:radical SAM/SPASM domain-containing protein [Abyssisolibacter fermentans]|uniref:radical SAM/SPASM domain-containing protein n=1 Tax=Abyssisolibacter fermentans TaxID=1766203 RepID=UPI0008336714|nr:radical SAM protein [Abyssisolibacter fermentans]
MYSDYHDIYSKYDLKKGNLTFMYLNITNKCNLRCRYCYDETSRVSKDTRSLSLENYQEIARDSKKLGLKRICITGGEPFVNKDWFEIGKAFYEAGISISFSSNGTLITEDSAKKLKMLEADIQISLDGNEDVMHFVTRVPKTFNKIIKSINLLKSEGLKVTLNSVIGKHNRDMVKYINQISKEKNIITRINFYYNSLNDGEGKIAPLSIEEIDEIIYEVNDMAKTNKNLIMALPPLLTPENINVVVNPGCGWAYHVAGILHNGDVTVCGIASGLPELVAGNILNTSFYKIWTESELFKKLRKNDVQQLKGLCAECPVNNICFGYCRLDSYIREKDICGGFNLCQQYYKAMLDGRIKKNVFPSKILELF